MTGLCKKTLMRNQFSWPFSLMGLQTKPSSQKLPLCIAQHLAVSSTLQRPSENRPTHTKQSRSGVSCQKQHKDRCKTTYPQIKYLHDSGSHLFLIRFNIQPASNTSELLPLFMTHWKTIFQRCYHFQDIHVQECLKLSEYMRSAHIPCSVKSHCACHCKRCTWTVRFLSSLSAAPCEKPRACENYETAVSMVLGTWLRVGLVRTSTFETLQIVTNIYCSNKNT